VDRNKIKNLIKIIKRLTKVESEELLEKDFYLTILLSEISKTNLGKKLIFKEGTALAKAYLDHARISEDLDFNWRERDEFFGLSGKKIRKICSIKITEIGETLAGITTQYNMDFKVEKDNKDYIQMRSNGKQATFKIWYDSVFGERNFIKLEISFMESTIFPTKRMALKSIFDLASLKEEDRTYLKDILVSYESQVFFEVFDIKEILSEKTRALLTRRKIKTRDILDVYLIQKKYNVGIKTFRSESKEKLIFAIKNYEKYKENFDNLTKHELTRERVLLENVRPLLVIDMDMNDFNTFVDKFLVYINELIKEVKEEMK
jgi:predicted nucleotidyltransferase component of viral defense system